MAVSQRNGRFQIFFKPFGTKRIGLTLDVPNEREARLTETLILRACRSGDYSILDAKTRELVVKMFRNQRWELPECLDTGQRTKEVLTFGKACELFLRYPGVTNAPSRWRYEIALTNLATFFGMEYPLRSVWVPELKQYQVERQQQGAAPDTINRETSSLSRLFSVMMELQLVESNPCRMLKRLSAKSGERQVYLSKGMVAQIASHSPEWFMPLVWAGYFTGMRRGEILGLKRKQVNLSSRIIVISPDGTKEGQWKRVPIHKDLVPMLEDALSGPALLSGRVFALKDAKGVRDIELEAFKNPWPRACESLALGQPWPRFHDLRHTWKTNARRSGMDPEIRESILGHATRQRSVSERYGVIGDRELISAIDSMTFDHGQTEIHVSDSGHSAPAQHSRNILEGTKKKAVCETA